MSCQCATNEQCDVCRPVLRESGCSEGWSQQHCGPKPALKPAVSPCRHKGYELMLDGKMRWCENCGSIGFWKACHRGGGWGDWRRTTGGK